MSVNKVILIGNLGKDPECRTLENGTKVANFSLATTESYKDKKGEKQQNTEWHNIVFYGPVVEVVGKYLKKGSKIYLEGKLRTRSYESDGVKKYTTEILGSQLTMLSSADKQQVTSTVSNEDEENDLPF